jgi:hypothetical protein
MKNAKKAHNWAFCIPIKELFLCHHRQFFFDCQQEHLTFSLKFAKDW